MIFGVHAGRITLRCFGNGRIDGIRDLPHDTREIGVTELDRATRTAAVLVWRLFPVNFNTEVSLELAEQNSLVGQMEQTA
jgi:hypothetical protein